MMQIMDLFPQLVSQVDHSKARQPRQDAKRTSHEKQFSDVLSAVREQTGKPRSSEAGRIGSSDKAAVSAEGKTETTESKTENIDPRDMGELIEDDADETEDITAISVLTQAGVVLILEGNKEIDSAPEQAVNAISGVGAMTEDGAPIIEGEEAPVAQVAVQETVSDDEVTEQMARMPEVTEKPREEKTEKSDDGELCPLENENEISETKGKKDKTPRVAQTAEDKAVENDDIKQERVIPTHQTVDVRPERLSGAEQMRGVAAQQPVSQENLFEAMVDKVETMQADGVNKMSIQLKPEYLGKVSLQLSMSAQGLQVRINADDLNVRHAIGGQINALIETLQSKGVAIAEVEVLYTGAGSYDTMSGQGGNAQPEQSAPSRRYARGGADDMSGFDIPDINEAPGVLDTELSSVEYRA